MKNKKVGLILFAIIVFVFGLVSCSSNSKDQSTADLEAQVAALQTQNALLQAQNDQKSDSLLIPDAPNTNSGPEIIMATPTDESLPTSSVPAGQPITYDGWAITVSKEVVIDYEAFGITFIVRNLGESDRVFRYQLAGVTITDDLGNAYQPTDDSICEEYMYITKNLSISGNDSEQIYTPSGFRNCHSENGLQQFSGPISINAKQLFIHLDNFGPLSDTSYVIDL